MNIVSWINRLTTITNLKEDHAKIIKAAYDHPRYFVGQLSMPSSLSFVNS